MTQNKKRTTLLLLVATLVALILLSGGLSNMELHEGSPFPGGVSSDNEVESPANLSLSGTYAFTLLKGVLTLVLLILMIYMPIRLMVLVNTKRILRLIFLMIPILLCIIMISRIGPGQPAYSPSESFGLATPSSSDYSVSPLGDPPRVLINLVAVAFLFVAGLVALKVLKRWVYRSDIKGQLLQEAEMAVNEIKLGGDLRNVIVRCYVQMTRALQEERKIKRGDSMTVREFEDWLESRGFPVAPVHGLTQLFEKVRYGAQLTMADDEKTAVESLNAIIQYCRNESE